MSGVSKEIKRRLRSIKNTRQITRAMEMVSAVKMRKSVQAVLASRNYSHTAWRVLDSLLAVDTVAAHSFVSERNEGKVCCIVISGNRGLAGSFNGNIADAVFEYLSQGSNMGVVKDHASIITLGTKARDELIARGNAVLADFPKADVVSSARELEGLISYVFHEYRNKVFKRIVLFYTDYQSALKQTVRTRVLLPLSVAEDPHLGAVDRSRVEEDAVSEEYVFDQEHKEVINVIIPRILEAQLFQAVLESQASEHSSRMLAMRNASEAASDMITELTLEYNKQRQSSITQELAEISASRMALAG